MAELYSGELVAQACEVRFAYSGKVVGVGKSVGDKVKQGEWIASLDRKILQTELDLELADYEKARADFEIFGIKNGQGGGDIIKYERQEKQAALNASVKRVELAKYKLDQADIASPVQGVIIDMSGLVNGVNITPASASVTIADMTSLKFRFDVAQKDSTDFLASVHIKITFPMTTKEYTGATLPLAYCKGGVCTVLAAIDNCDGLLPGFMGKATVL